MREFLGEVFQPDEDRPVVSAQDEASEAERQWRRAQYERRQRELAAGVCSHGGDISLCPCCSPWA